MTVRIHYVGVDEAAPGVELGADIRDSQGTILLMAGTQLTEAHLASLRRRGVQRVPLAERVVLTEPESEALREAARARLRYLFRHGEPDEADRLLYRVVLEYRMEQL